MNNVERFVKLMAFEPVDRLPLVEWAGWWDKTLDRWYKEGLPGQLKDAGEIREYFGLDCYRQLWIGAKARTYPRPADYSARSAGVVHDMSGYRKLKAHLYPERAFDEEQLAAWGARQKSGEMVVWISLDGFFWHPRELLGVECHLYTFYDDPELMHAINSDLLDYNLRVIDEVCKICTPNFMTLAEDMSYNNGPMLSKECFSKFLAPYYGKLTAALKARGIIPFVDSDGDVNLLIEWLKEVGIDGILPLERMAGVDVAQIRKSHPHFRMIGAFDKTVMHRGTDAMRREFERLLPVMKQGGFIPSVDHQTPPDVSLDQYRRYVSLLKEYCEKAGS